MADASSVAFRTRLAARTRILDRAVLTLIACRKSLYPADPLRNLAAAVGSPMNPREVRAAAEKLRRGDWMEKGLDGNFAVATL